MSQYTYRARRNESEDYMDSAAFKDDKVPSFEEVFVAKAKASVEILTLHKFEPRLDDSGDELESAISQLSDMWNMFFENDGNTDADYEKWWNDYIDAIMTEDYSKSVVYCDDIRNAFLKRELLD